MSHRARATWKRLAVASAALFCANPATSQTSQDIYRVNLSTGAVRRVSNIPGTEAYNPVWAPDGSKIAHDVKGASAPLGHSVYVTVVSTGASTLLTGADGGNDASWSPDGRTICFATKIDGRRTLAQIPSDGGTVK